MPVPAIARRLPYVYTSLYEGGERRPGVYCSGEVPNFQIVPALAWMARHLGKRRWFVVGDDYVWPRQTAVVLTEACALGIEIVGEAFVRMAAGRVGLLVEEVARTACEGVLMLLVGQEAALFNRLFAGLRHRMVQSMSTPRRCSRSPDRPELNATPASLDLAGAVEATLSIRSFRKSVSCQPRNSSLPVK
jgi:ABC-type branched-subunit amino acid transport system substrate-binding protein